MNIMSIYIIPAVTIISVVIFTLWIIISKIVDYKRRQDYENYVVRRRNEL